MSASGKRNDEQSPRAGGKGLWWVGKRFLLAALGIVLVTAGATVAIAHNEVSGLVAALDQNKAVHLAPGVLAPTSRGAARDPAAGR